MTAVVPKPLSSFVLEEESLACQITYPFNNKPGCFHNNNRWIALQNNLSFFNDESSLTKELLVAWWPSGLFTRLWTLAHCATAWYESSCLGDDNTFLDPSTRSMLFSWFHLIFWSDTIMCMSNFTLNCETENLKQTKGLAKIFKKLKN